MIPKAIQVVEAGAVTNVILVDDAATISKKGKRIDWEGDGLDAPDGATFMDVEGAQIGWTVSGNTLVAPPEPEAPPVDLVAYAADARWRKEVGGIVIGGIPVATDDRSKAMIIGARVAAQADPDWTTVWHGTDGGAYPLNAASMLAISNAVEAHVNGTFATFAIVKADIDAGKITATAEIDAAFA